MIKSGTLMKCVKLDPECHLDLGLRYTCLDSTENTIKLITVRGGEQWFPVEYFGDLFRPQGD